MKLKLKHLLIFIIAYSNSTYADSDLSSESNVYPFKYYPLPGLELTVEKKDNRIQIFHPNQYIQEFTIPKGIGWALPNITQDLNFDGYTDLAIWFESNARGNNDNYIIYLWNNEKLKLEEAEIASNLGISSNFLTSSYSFGGPPCPLKEAFCYVLDRYKWEKGNLVMHSSLFTAENSTQISFYKNEKLVKKVTVPSDMVDFETQKWDLNN